MRAFEIFLNGRTLCIAGLDEGTVLAALAYTITSRGRGGVGLNVTGMRSNLETVGWIHRAVRLNDRVEVKVIEAQMPDKPRVMQKAPRDERKYEKAWVVRMAKEFGWTIQKGRGKRSGQGPKPRAILRRS